MKRAFLTLYVLIVTSILVSGVLLDSLWGKLEPNQDRSNNYRELAFHILQRLEGVSKLQAEDYLAKINTTFGNSSLEEPAKRYQWLNLNELGGGQFKRDLLTNGEATIQNDQFELFYFLSSNQKNVLVIREIDLESTNESHRLLYIAFILLFYLVIALVIAFWMWPLTRDLLALNNFVSSYRAKPLATPLLVAEHSLIAPVAKGFNEMAVRIAKLVQSHQEMRNAVSHELRTPLARMKFALAMIDPEQANTETHKALKQVEMDIQAMETLINGLLTYAGFETQTQQLQQYEGYIREFIADLVRLKQKEGTKPLEISFESITENQKIVCEWQLMGHVLDNLLVNAQRFAKEKIHISLVETAESWRISVEDDGPGVRDEDQAKVFEAFYRAGSSENGTSGFGLGLAIVARIMEWHQGAVRCGLSRFGGAKFEIEWPKLADH